MSAQNDDVKSLLEESDVLVDGQFLLARRSLQLDFRGSDNQRVIDMQKLRSAGGITLWEAEDGV